jgi:hypothetical protein
MPPNSPERRRAVRRTPHADESLSRVRLRTGRELAVIDISSAGALIEGTTRLLPGTRSDVHVVTRHGRLLVRTRVIRSFIWRLERDVVCYRTALEFDTAVETDGPALSERSESNGPALSERSESNGPALSERSESNGPALSERSESNGYPVPPEIPRNDEAAGTRYPDAMGERSI